MKSLDAQETKLKTGNGIQVPLKLFQALRKNSSEVHGKVATSTVWPKGERDRIIQNV